MKIPSNYRQVKTDDTIRKGDIYRRKNNFADVGFVHLTIGRKVCNNSDYTFWRQRKTAKVTPRVATLTPAQPTANKKNVTIVEFTYNEKLRQVQLISLDGQYLTGLEITRTGSRYNYQFKKYFRYKIEDNGLISLYYFGEPLTNS